MKKSPQTYWLAYAIVAFATLLYFAPLLSAYPQLVIPSPYPDALEFIWTTWRLEGVLNGSEDLYATHEVFAPQGASLLLHTVCEGLLLPITFVFAKLEPIWRFNCAVLVAFLLNGFAAISLFRVLGATPVLSALAALLIVFAPNQMGHLTAGHLNFLVLFPLLEVFRFLIVCHRRAQSQNVTRLDTARAILAVVFMGRTNLYFLYYSVLLAAAFSLWWFILREATVAKLRSVWSVLLAGLAVNMLHLYRVAELARSKRYTPDHDPSATSADLLAYVLPSSLQRIGLISNLKEIRSSVEFHEGETSLYIGMLVLVAVGLVCAIRSVRRSTEVWMFVALMCAAMLASFGPWLTFGGVRVVWNPFDYVLRALLPMYPSVPARFGLFVGISTLCIVVLGLQACLPGAKRTLIHCLLLLAIIELCPIRCNVTQLSPASPVLNRLRDDQSVRVVVDQPIITQHAMLRQTIHGKALVGGFLSRRPRKEERELRSNPFLQRVGALGKEYSVEALRAGWCALSSDALLIEAPRVPALKDTLQGVGLTLRDEDGAWALFEPAEGVCW